MIRTSRIAADRVRVTFALPEIEVTGRTSVVGDFNDWQPGRHELRRRSNGTRSAVVELPAGSRVTFRYLAEGDRWFDEHDLGRDETGNCLLDT